MSLARARRRTLVAVAVLAGVLATVTPASVAAPPPPPVSDPASASEPAVPLDSVVDAVSVSQTGPLTTAVRDKALLAAAAAGANAVVGRSFTAGMSRVWRGPTVIQQSTGPGWAFPMGVTALPVEAVRAVMGRANASWVNGGYVVMGQTSASIRGAQAGDVIDLLGPFGTTVSLTIGRVAPDSEVGGAELVMSIDTAARLGGTIDTRVLLYGPFDRWTVSSALAAQGLFADGKVRIRQSWDPPDPDSTMGMAETKKLLGEFDIDYAHLTTDGWTATGSAWRSAYLPAGRETYPTGIKAMCNKVIKADLQAALQEIATTLPGLVGAYTGIDVANTNTYGGCSNGGAARFSRITQALGSVSRHSWGQPLDTSTVANCQGCVPKMDCRIVRIFRKHGFAWGGNFLLPDGMHFEWVGEPRNTLQYPSKYCPNPPSANSVPPDGTTGDRLFADDGLTDE